MLGPILLALGDLLIIIASVIVSVQMVYEQKYVTKYNVPPLLAVGLEGEGVNVMDCQFGHRFHFRHVRNDSSFVIAHSNVFHTGAASIHARSCWPARKCSGCI